MNDQKNNQSCTFGNLSSYLGMHCYLTEFIQATPVSLTQIESFLFIFLSFVATFMFKWFEKSKYHFQELSRPQIIKSMSDMLVDFSEKW